MDILQEQAALYGCLLPHTLTLHTLKQILKHFGSVQAMYSRCNAELESLDLPIKIIQTLKTKRDTFVLEKIIEDFDQHQAQIITFYDHLYPQSFYSMKNPPLLLFIQGNSNLLNMHNIVGIVGSRNPSFQSLVKLENTIHLLLKDTVVMTGFAEGVDTFVLKTCIDSNFKTIIVLPCGIDIFRKTMCRDLYQQLLTHGSLFISEFPLNTPSYRSNYPIRNKTIAILANHIIAVDKRPNSGTSLTANYARSFGKSLVEICSVDSTIPNVA